MKSLKLFSWSLTLVVLLGACSKDEPKRESVARTVLMYLVADNSISSDIYGNIASVEAGLKQVKTPGTFVIYWDGGSRYKSEFPTPTLFKYEVTAGGKVSKRTVIQTYGEQNSVSPEVMLNVFADVKRLCPNQHYGLIFGSHATGWLPADPVRTRSLGDDNGAKISIPDLADILSKTNTHFDYILMDACLMSQIEVAYELKNVADYLILSPAEVMSTGFPYKSITEHLLATNDRLEESICKVAQGYIDYYKNEASYRWATIAVIKCAEIAPMTAVMASIMENYKDRIQDFDTQKLSEFQRLYGYGRNLGVNARLDYSSYDLSAFVRELTDRDVPAVFEEQLNRLVVYKGYVNINALVNIDKDVYSGIGCYIPHAGYTNWNNYFKTLKWYDVAGWSKMGW